MDNRIIIIEPDYNGGYMESKSEVYPCLRSQMKHNEPLIVAFDPRGNGGGEITPTLTGNHQDRITDYTAIVVEKIVKNSKDEPLMMRGGCWTLDEKCGKTYCWEEQANTLASRDYKQPQIVAYSVTAYGLDSMNQDVTEEISPTLRALRGGDNFPKVLLIKGKNDE